MTNEQLKEAIAIEATRRWKERGVHFIETLANIAVELTQEGWTPPVAVDPDLAEAEKLAYAWNVNEIKDVYGLALAAIKRGRALAAAEAKPGLVWVKHEQSNTSPVPGSMVTVMFHKGHYETGPSFMFDWWRVDYYAIITPPEDVA